MRLYGLMLSGLLLLGACWQQKSSPEAEQNLREDTPMMIQNSSPDLKQYQGMLNSMRTANQHGQLTVTQIKLALSKAEDFPKELQNQALDLLKQTVSAHGTDEAKSFYSLNPSLNLVDVFSAVPADRLPENLRALMSAESSELSLEHFYALPSSDREDLLMLAEQAKRYYFDKASEMRMASNPQNSKAEDIAMFIFQAQEQSGSSANSAEQIN